MSIFMDMPKKPLISRRALLVGGGVAAVSGGAIAAGIWLARGDELATLRGHTGVVRGVAFSPEGGTLASVGDNGEVRLWDVATRKLLRTLDGHKGKVHAVAFARTGGWLATGGADHSVRFWNAADGACTATWEASAKGIECLAIGPNADVVAAGGNEKMVTLWDAVARKPLRSLKPHGSHVHGLAFSADGKRLASASEDGTVHTWEWRAGTQPSNTMTIDRHHIHGLTAAGGALVACVNGIGPVLWDWSGPAAKPTGVAFDGCGLALAAAITDDARTLVTGHEDRVVRVWSASGGGPRKVLRGHGDLVLDVAVSPDAALVATASADHTVKLFALPPG